MLRMTQFWHVFSYLSFIFMIKGKVLNIYLFQMPFIQKSRIVGTAIYRSTSLSSTTNYITCFWCIYWFFFHLYTERNNGGADFLIVNYIKAFHFRSCKLLTTSKTYSVLFRINKSSNEQMSLKYFQNICRHI